MLLFINLSLTKMSLWVKQKTVPPTVNLFSLILKTCRSTWIIGHPQIIENQSDISCKLTHFLCNASCAFGFDDTNGESSESGDVFRAVAGAYAAAIFIVVPIEDIVTAITRELLFLLTYDIRSLIPRGIRYSFRIQNYSRIQLLFFSSGQSIILWSRGK